MKRDKIIYWIATGLVSAGMLMSAGMYLTKNPELMQTFRSVGYPDFFVPLLGTAKLLGAVILVIPVWNNLKEWAYAGFGFTFIGAIWTHVATSTPWIAPLVFLIILSVSYWFRTKLRTTQG
ncbi:MAG TPA: DoxX family protein [Cyclobacteriaceae bacterium]|nr:DoxX family protein [Cyclobacteriaceae bacterium]